MTKEVPVPPVAGKHAMRMFIASKYMPGPDGLETQFPDPQHMRGNFPKVMGQYFSSRILVSQHHADTSPPRGGTRVLSP